MYKDHKMEGGYRQVVGGCNSNTLGLSNMISEVLESVAVAINSPYAVISSEDMLARVSETNLKLEKLTAVKNDKLKDEIEQADGLSSNSIEIDGLALNTEDEMVQIIDDILKKVISKERGGPPPDFTENVPKTEIGPKKWDWRDHYALIGTDVKSMFPNLTSDRTADAIRAQVEKSRIAWDNIDVKTLMLYIKLNEDKVKNQKILNSIKRYLPIRKQRSKRGRKPTISSKKQSEKWLWPSLEASRGTLKRLLGVGLGIVVKFIFENFVYTFGGRYYLQKKGAPIGNRVSMCGAQITMQEWRDKFVEILERSEIEELLAGLYVDDGRNLIEILKLGVRFCEMQNAFIYNKEWEELDSKLEISGKDRTKREVLNAMNSISPDIQFTIEDSEDFSDKRLPTLSFSIWEEEWGISHSYYEKEMRSQVLLMERSAMSAQSKYSIMTNELRRRLEVLHDKIEVREKLEIVNKYTQQLVNSGYGRNQIKEIIVSAFRGYERKVKERKKAGKPKFRHSHESVNERTRKKLIENTTWFKNTRKRKEESEKKKKVRKDLWKHPYEKESDSPQAVLFVAYTYGSELVKRIRKAIQILKPFCKINLKVVERAGKKIIDTLHKSNPWEDGICERDNCLPCQSSIKGKDEAIRNCKKRSVTYQTWCHTCREKLKVELLKKYELEKKSEAEKEEESRNGKRKRKETFQQKKEE